MLRTLSIHDFVIVDAIELELGSGFTVFTGETGAGKSILIDALALALGGRGDASVVREGANKADISAEFATGSEAEAWLDVNEFGSDDGSVLPFKKGPFALALKSRVPVVPITIEGSGSVMPKNSWNIKPGPVYVKIGKPIDTTRFAEDDREGLARAVRDVIIQQSLELGGKGGDPERAVAAAGVEGDTRSRSAS